MKPPSESKFLPNTSHEPPDQDGCLAWSVVGFLVTVMAGAVVWYLNL